MRNNRHKDYVNTANRPAPSNGFQGVLLRDLSAANRTPLVGIINLRVTLDRMNQSVGCQTSPASAELLKALPAGVKRSDPQALSDLVMQQVLGCLVNLHPAAAHPEALKVDGALQVRLNARCRTLDLRQMPGFAPNAQGRVDGYVTVEYAPWKADR